MKCRYCGNEMTWSQLFWAYFCDIKAGCNMWYYPFHQHWKAGGEVGPIIREGE